MVKLMLANALLNIVKICIDPQPISNSYRKEY